LKILVLLRLCEVAKGLDTAEARQELRVSRVHETPDDSACCGAVALYLIYQRFDLCHDLAYLRRSSIDPKLLGPSHDLRIDVNEGVFVASNCCVPSLQKT